MNALKTDNLFASINTQFKKFYQKNGFHFEFEYYFNSKKTVIEKQLNEDLEKTINCEFLDKGLYFIVMELRRLLAPFNEGYMSIKLTLPNKDHSEAIFLNGELVSCVEKAKVSDQKIVLDYSLSQGTNLQVKKLNDKSIAGEDTKYLEKLQEMLSVLNDLKNIKTAKDLASEDNLLITIYNLFYSEYPDLTLTETTEKFQCMIAILHTISYPIIPNNSDHNYKVTDISSPISEYITNRIDYLRSFGNNLNKSNVYSMKPNIKASFIKIGLIIREFLAQYPEEEQIKVLNVFAIQLLRRFYHEDYDNKYDTYIRLLEKNEYKN